VNVATKSGTNTFRGTAYEFFRNEKLAANSYDNTSNGIEKGKYRRDTPSAEETVSPATRPAERPQTRVCVTPAGATSGVRISTEAQGVPVVEETLVADGTERPVEDKTCRGARSAEWSRSGYRLFSRAEITCAGEPPHSVSHLATVFEDTWIDIQGITREGRQGLRVRRYRREADEAAALERPPGTGSFGIEDVKEASAKVTPLVLQAALVETAARFRLRARTMIELDRAGVADEVTDLMVALSYPDRFAVARVSTSGAGGEVFHPGGAPDWTSDDVYLWGYAPFAYSYWGFDDYWYSPDVVIIGDRNEGGGERSSGGGRVVNGRGYTRIEPAEVAQAARGENSESGSTSSTAPASGDSGGVSSQGYSSGGSSGDSDRTAQPRPDDD
jgi:hypothetical protein